LPRWKRRCPTATALSAWGWIRRNKAIRALGLRTVAHAGEEGPATYIREALDLLGVDRIDHGVRCDEDPTLVDRLARERMPLTVCPLSNVKLGVIQRLEDHNLARLLRRGVAVTINSDDPAYFGGYIGDNFIASARALALAPEEVVQLAENAIRAAFLPATEKAGLLIQLRSAAASARA